MDSHVIRIIIDAHDRASKVFAAVAAKVAAWKAAMGVADKDGQKFDSTLGRLGARLRTLGVTFGHAARDVGRFGLALAKVPWILFTRLGQIALILVARFIVVAGVLTTVLIGLVASLNNAAYVLGGAFLAAVSQAIPAVAVLALGISRITKAFEAANKVEQQRQQLQQQSIPLHRAERDAMRGVRDAQLGIADAQYNLAQAQKNLNDTRRQARRDLQDLILAEKQARLAAEQSSLALIDAEGAREDALRRGGLRAGLESSINVRGARLDRQDALIGAGRAGEDAARARAKGVEGSDAVAGARRQIAQATRGLAQAQEQLARANEALADSLLALKGTPVGGEDPYKDLSNAEKTLAQRVLKLKETYREAFRPVTDIIVRSFTTVIDRLIETLEDPRVITAAKDLAGSIGDSIEKIGEFFLGKKGREQFLIPFMEQATESIPKLTEIFLDLVEALAQLSLEFNPALQGLLDGMKRISDEFEKWSGDKDFKTIISDGMGQLKALGDVLSALGGLIQAIIKLFDPAEFQSGGGLAALADGIRALTKVIDDPKFREDFQGFIDKLNSIVTAIDTVIGKFSEVFRMLESVFKKTGMSEGMAFLAAGFVAAVMVKLIPAVFTAILKYAAQWGIAAGRSFMATTRGLPPTVPTGPPPPGTNPPPTTPRPNQQPPNQPRGGGSWWRRGLGKAGKIGIYVGGALVLVDAVTGGDVEVPNLEDRGLVDPNNEHLGSIGRQKKAIEDFYGGIGENLDTLTGHVRDTRDQFQRLKDNIGKVYPVDSGRRLDTLINRDLPDMKDKLQPVLTGFDELGQKVLDAATDSESGWERMISATRTAAAEIGESMGGIGADFQAAGDALNGLITAAAGAPGGATPATGAGGGADADALNVRPGQASTSRSVRRAIDRATAPARGRGDTGDLPTGNRGGGGTGRLTRRALAAAQILSSEELPYVFGGGHTNPARATGSTLDDRDRGEVGMDCSSAVSWVLQAAGYAFPTQGTGTMPDWFRNHGWKPAQQGDPIQVYVRNGGSGGGHTWMRINGNTFGSTGNGTTNEAFKAWPGGYNGSYQSVWAPPRFASGGIMPGRRGDPGLAILEGGETVLPTHRLMAGGGPMADVIKKAIIAALRAGINPALFLASGLVESGLRHDAVGDNGTSFGAFQWHRGGALGSHDPAWTRTQDAFNERARAFAAARGSGGARAADAQRPADPAGYAQKVNAAMAQASKILTQYQAVKDDDKKDDNKGGGDKTAPTPARARNPNPAAMKALLDFFSDTLGAPGTAKLRQIGRAGLAFSLGTFADLIQNIVEVTAKLKNPKDGITKPLLRLFGEGGLIAQLFASVDEIAQRAATRITARAFSAKGGDIRRIMSPEAIAAAQFEEAKNERQALVEVGANINRGETALNAREVGFRKRLAQVDKELKTAKGARRTSLLKERQSLLKKLNETIPASRRDITGQRAELDQRLAANAEELVTAQENQQAGTFATINETASRAIGRQDQLESIRRARGDTSFRPGVFDEKARQISLQGAGLRQLLTEAQSTGNAELAKQIQDQLDQLDVAFAENARAKLDAQISTVNAAASRGLASADVKQRLAELGVVTDENGTILSNTGGERNIGAISAALQSKGATLATQRTGLLGALDTAILEGNAEVAADLRQQLQENTLATIENNKSLRELTDVNKELQGYSSTAWREYRVAIGTGLGGVIPALPQMADGGRILRTGALIGHFGERIVPAAISRESGGGDQTINLEVNHYGNEPVDPQYLSSVIAMNAKAPALG